MLGGFPRGNLLRIPLVTQPVSTLFMWMRRLI